MGNKISGIFIPLEDEEYRDIMDALTEMGYTADGTGLKEFIADCLSEPEKVGDEKTETFIDQMRAFIKENPATVNMSIDTISSIMKTIMGKIK